MRTYNLFISHAWSYGDQYKRLVEFFDEAPYFDYWNYSVPKDDPVHTTGSDRQLYEAIKNHIQPVHCVVMMAGVYATYSKWINKEIQIAKSDFSKPIVAVEPWGSERTSIVVKNNADRTVRWQSSSIVGAIKEVALR